MKETIIPDISVMDNFFNEKELHILQGNLNKINFRNAQNQNGTYGFSHDFEENKNNKWLYDKIKNVFFPNFNFKVMESAFRLRHNQKEVLYHIDAAPGMEYNFICYLKGKELMYNGTGFYNYKSDLDRYIGFVKNRALFFKGSKIYHADLQALGPSSPRYSVNIFYKDEGK